MFLLCCEFLLLTDHAALRNHLRHYLLPITSVKRWILPISEYIIKIEYQKGLENVIAKMLSRLPFASKQITGDKTSLDEVACEKCILKKVVRRSMCHLNQIFFEPNLPDQLSNATFTLITVNEREQLDDY